MSDRIPALLEPIQNRLNAELPDAARMDAYYYGFTRTGLGAVDAILSAVAVAGKGSHHTESWAGTDSAWFYGDRPGLPSADGAEDLIQKTADLAAKNITTDQARLLAAIQAVAEIHEPDIAAGPDGEGITDYCPACSTYWPCPTVAAVESALGGEA